MKKTLCFSALIILACSVSYAGYIDIDIVATATNLSGDTWQYSFDIANMGTDTIRKITIWFDYGDMTNLFVTTQDSGGWTENVIPADDFLAEGAAYDIENVSTGLAPGQELADFTVSFQYTGIEPLPALHHSFDVVDPETFATLYSGETVPEPATLFLISLGGFLATRKR